MRRHARSLLMVFLLWVGVASPPAAARAGEVTVAVAANFTEPAKVLAQRFQMRTGHRAVLVFGSSGQFYAQIRNGAPYAVFLSADAERPAAIEADGLAAPGSRFTYAVGRLVLYSRDPRRVDPGGAVLRRGTFQKLAIADPKSAPYGRAAVETLQSLGVYGPLQPRLVQGGSITQAYQFVETGAAELGFVALSQVILHRDGSRWIVPASRHAPILQQAVLLKTGASDAAAQAFMRYLRSPEAKTVIRRYGYGTP